MGSMSQIEGAGPVCHTQRERRHSHGPRLATGLRPLSSRGGLWERERVGAGLGEGVGLRAR